MKSTSEKSAAWRKVQDAEIERSNVEGIFYDVDRLATHLEDVTEGEIQLPLSSTLESLIKRAELLSTDFESYVRELEERYQNSAWEFAKIEWNIVKGDQIEHVNQNGKKEVLYAETLHLGEDFGALVLDGSVQTKRGIAGKRGGWVRLTQETWKNLTPEHEPTDSGQPM